MMAARKQTIMLVEDDDEARGLFAEILETEGFNVIAFANGREALEHLRNAEAPCLMILDLRMPVMDGAQLRSVMLQDRRLAKIPAIVVSAFAQAANTADLSLAKVLKKPVDVTALLSVVRRYC
jgi:CheY-like chemotaxis protein